MDKGSTIVRRHFAMTADPNIKILLVEDAATMRKMEIKILHQLGFKNIVEAVDGRDALDKIKAEPDAQIIISDWAMPNMDGLELLKCIRSEEGLKDLPMVMATGQGDKGSVSKALEAGANGVVTKPFTPDELKTVIEVALGIRQSPVKKMDSAPRVDTEGKVRLRMAHIQITDHLTLGVMKDFLEKGVKTTETFALETRCMPSWNPVQEALEKGEVDGAFILAPAAMDLFNYSVPIRLVMLSHRNGSIFVRNKSTPYRKPFQQFFKHKTFFIPHKMSIHNMLAHIYFNRLGLKPGLAGMAAVNVLFDVVPPVKMPEFLSENQDACGFMVAEPIGSRAIASGIAERHFLSSEIWENHPCCLVVFREEFISQYPAAVQEFCNLLVDAGRFIGEHPDEAAEIAVNFLDPDRKLGLKAPILKQVLTDPKGIKTDNLFPVIKDLDTIQRYMVDQMGIGSIIDLEAFVDLRFAEEACKGTPKRGAGSLNLDQKSAFHPLAEGRMGVRTVKGKQEDRVPSSEGLAAGSVREGKYLTFGIGDERFGLGILDVREIVGMMPIRTIPQVPEFIKGVVNLRGKVIPVVDMRLKFGMAPMDYSDRTCIIVTEVSGTSGSTLMGIVVDRVLEVTEFKEHEIEDCPVFGSTLKTDFILGIAKREREVTMLLDIDRILQAQDKVYLSEAA
jgi:chemotaxis signal transduction protein/ABC-type nitrate/sulfonate/bicarbonate transport system substrate-binding protein/CheY-like chemotaxis protein